MSPVAKTVPVVASVVLAGSLGFLTWQWLNQSSQGALAAALEAGKAYAARVLEEVGAVPDELKESSGLAISRTQPGVLWSHNDSGDGPNLYAIDMSGKLLARFSVTNATARDWEDISAGPCPADVAVPASPGRSECLFIADMGDNDSVRPDLTIYIVVEPRVGGAGSATSPTVAPRSFRFRYPSGPTDAEALAVRPNGDLTIVSKGRSGTIDFFSIPASAVERRLRPARSSRRRTAATQGFDPTRRQVAWRRRLRCRPTA